MNSAPGRNSGVWLTRILLLLCAVAVFPFNADGAQALSEYEVKAAFLLNFTKFVEWPSSAFASADSPLTICILGQDPFGRTMDQIVEGELINGRRIAVERLQTEQQKTCQVLYSAAPLPSVPFSAILTVGEGDDFLHHGGIIAFVLDNRHVRFDINLKAANNAGLRLSSKLLSVARSVEK